jgi:predicted nucleotidyltransferase component of viral defense system
MIHFHSLTLPWIQAVSAQHKIPDRTLLEKTIRALVLLESLAVHHLPFVFKGGTALMLLLDTRRRLSIDIDIIMPVATDDLLDRLTEVATQGGFRRVELHTRGQRSGLQKAHYKFWYAPSYVTHSQEDYVLLDIVFEPIRYIKLQNLPIVSPLLRQEGEPMQVAVPSIEDILGDKLTAFAPGTTGIPYFKNGDPKAMEIMKQLFDIGCLFELVQDVGRVKGAFWEFALAELAYRNLDVGVAAVLRDIVDTAYCISLRGNHAATHFGELQTGIQRVQSFIFSEHFHLDRAITHAARAAYLALAIAHDASALERFEMGMQLGDALIMDPTFNKLNKLKKSNVEAFFYWRAALALVEVAARSAA